MKHLEDLSVQGKLTVITVLSVGLALLLACGALAAYDRHAFRQNMVRQLSTHADILGRQTTSALVFGDPDSARATLSALRAEPHVLGASLYSRDGSLFAAYQRDEGTAAPSQPEARKSGHVFERQRLRLFRTVEFDGAPLATVVIESDLGEATERLWRYGFIAASVLLVSLLVAFAAATRLQRALTGPVLQLVETARAVADRQDYSVRGTAHGHGELALLTRTFNDMLDQIQARELALQQARDTLELQVDERTKELRAEVAERKALEEELRRKNQALVAQSRQVQEATRLKSEFLANMSHELRTPLNAIIGFAELMHDAKVGPVSAAHKECLADILTSSRHLLQLINDVLDLSKVEAGKMEFRPEPVRLADVVGEVRDILRSLSAKKRIAIETEFDPGVERVVVDPGKLKQVLYNFLSNAVKFTPEGGRIVVRTRAEGGALFRLEVQDTGIGIKQADLPRLFVEFQQLDASAAKAYPGTGLGLALTRRIVEAQGGSVGVESTAGQGSRFFAVLPRVPSEDQAAHAPARAPLPRPHAVGSPSILVIEDDTEERRWLAETLSGAGYEVETASTGREAVRSCGARAYDGITLDILLSDMSGWDVLRAIRGEGANRDTPIIIVTVVAERGLAVGVAIHDFLVKPVRAEDLLASLERAGVRPAGLRPILVVDDQAQARKLMETTLVGFGYQSRGAASAEEGLRLCAAEPPAAVILDLLMPDMDGFEFLERFRRTATGRGTPVIVWTAKDLTSDDQARLAASAHAVVLKGEAGTRSLMEELQACVGPPAPAPGAAHGG